MKANFIVGKKQIVLASLVLVLGVAVYLNWSFAKSNEEFEATGLLLDSTTSDNAFPLPTGATDDIELLPEAQNANADTVSETGVPEDSSKVKHLGDAQLVSARVIIDENYFVKAKLSRTRSRDEAVQTISTILDDEKLTEADKKLATERAISITDIIEAESNIENLVKAKGFEECMVYISGGNASVVVKTASLDQDSATQIKNIVATEGLVRGENVSITEIN